MDLLFTSVRIKKANVVNQKLEKLRKAGIDKLQVISDFDFTITKSHDENGNGCEDSYGVVTERRDHLSEEIWLKMKNLKEHYLPVLMDPGMTVDEKTPIVVHWWKEANRLLEEAAITRENIVEIVKNSNIILRDGFPDVQKILRKHEVPLLIFSAGLGDVIEEVLRQQSESNPNEAIIANYLRGNRTGKLLVHAFNKNYSLVTKNRHFVARTAGRTNVILLGDSLGDVSMSEGNENVETILKIGFLNSNCENKLNSFLDNFDIVLVNDPTMNLVIDLLQSIIQ